MKKLFISILLPVHNGEKYIATAIQSLLRQTYANFELIIIDDGSTDETQRIVNHIKDRRISLISNNQQKGISDSLNQGLTKARGKYVARMDADDISLPHRLQTQTKFLEQHPQTMLVGCWAELINSKGKQIGIKQFPLEYADIKSKILRFNPFIHPTLMFRRTLIKKIGGYKTKFDGAEDYDFCLRTAATYKVANIPQVLLQFRQSSSSVSFSEMQRVEYQALHVRINALLHYGYPWWHVIFMVKPGLVFLMPQFLKRKLYETFYGF